MHLQHVWVMFLFALLAGCQWYDPADVTCYEASLNDLNVFAVESTVTGNGSQTVLLEIDAGVVVDANPFSTEYQAGRIAYGLTLSITGTGGASWELSIDQHMQGLLATWDDGAGQANSGVSDVTASLSLGPTLSFGSPVTLTSAAGEIQAFSATRSGDLIQGTGDTVVTGNLEISLDAYSECGGLFCAGFSDEGAVLFGLDDISQSAFVSADEYATWAPRTVGPDGYSATFQLTGTGPSCGDGTTDPGLGEECDDGNQQSGDGCSEQCQVEFCGDGVTQPGLGEQCDDGNNIDADGCSALCQYDLVTVPALSNWGKGLLVLFLATLALLFFVRSLHRQALGPNR
ncbi:MAG: DUF4215 domain-containing protein [Myxococcota bacterium]